MKGRVVFFVCVLLALSAPLFGQEAAAEAGEGSSAGTGNTAIWKYFAAAAAVGISCIAGGIAVGQIGAAAMGAMSENSELSGKALPYAGLAEGICLWGFLVALLILIL
ncbi:MAG: ATP synthase subunit C [Spirochaetaceae bacterium]|jgi:V/A-type H+-transporting ATPase subunit K|nr:ATP synthase subunit C [Spirochaetaceae bacterium]